MSKTCVIVGAAEAGQISCPAGALVIAADGGYQTLVQSHITPDVAVGDFDSLGYRPPVADTIYHAPEKDDTDMMMSAREGLKRGCDTFLLYGGLGGRLDHTLANVQTLLFLKNHGAHCFLLGNGIIATILHNEAISFDKSYSGVLSVFCMGNRAEGVTIAGLHYSLQNETLTNDYPVGVSNQFEGVPSSVSVKNGTLLVIYNEEPKQFVQKIEGR